MVPKKKSTQCKIDAYTQIWVTKDVFLCCLHFREHLPSILINKNSYFLNRPNHQSILGSYTLHICLPNLQV